MALFLSSGDRIRVLRVMGRLCIVGVLSRLCRLGCLVSSSAKVSFLVRLVISEVSVSRLLVLSFRVLLITSMMNLLLVWTRWVNWWTRLVVGVGLLLPLGRLNVRCVRLRTLLGWVRRVERSLAA